MPSIGIVTDGNTNLGEFLTQNLKQVLQEHVTLNNYYLKTLLPDTRLDDEVVLVMMPDKIKAIAPYVTHQNAIMVLERTILLSSYHKLLEIPAGLEVLVVNDNDETSAETVALLTELGIKHIHLTPYKKHHKYPHIQLAITPGESQFVPSSIREILDIDHRQIDLSTFFTIITKLSLNHPNIHLRLKQYLEQIVSPYSVMKDKIQESLIKKNELQTVMHLSRDAVLLTDKEGNIRLANDAFKTFFHVEGGSELTLQTLLPKEWVWELSRFESVENLVLSTQNQVFNVHKKALSYYNTVYGYYYSFQELTYIRQLEQTLSKKIRSAGHVAKYHFKDIIHTSPVMKKVVTISEKMAKTDLNILLIGETGTGKELLAQSIHNASQRRNGPFIAINSAAMPEHLLESELFGYEEGAFTGAIKGGKKGLLVQANHGTVFLDEIGDMPISLQTKLLRVLQEKQVMAIGSSQVMDINVRFIFATHKNLEELIQKNLFRVDLYYRINAVQIYLPPLRERKEDILAIVTALLNAQHQLSDTVKDTLKAYPFKGNIRELINILHYCTAMAETSIIQIQDLPSYVIHQPSSKRTLVSHDILNALYTQGAMGRSKLMAHFHTLGYAVSESDVKQWLSELKSLGFIESSTGRGGSHITALGIEALLASPH